MVTNPVTCLPREAELGHRGGIFYGENIVSSKFGLLLLQISMINLITRVVMILLKPLKQPRIVLEIIGAIIIGPSVLGRNKDFSKFMFPDEGKLLINTIADLSKMYFVFVIGVQMDTSMITNAGKKDYIIGCSGMFFPFIVVLLSGYLLRNFLEKGIVSSVAAIGWISSSLAITSSPVLYPILKELNILNSSVGRFSMSISMISDVVGWGTLIILQGLEQAKDTTNLFNYFTSIIGLIFLVFYIVRPVTKWIIRRTPEGKPVEQFYVITILLGALIFGLISDIIGASAIDGPLMLGLAIPDGLPLGATIVSRSENIIMDVLMPVFYATVGLNTDFFSMTGWTNLWSLFIICLVGYTAKLLGTLLPSLFCFNMAFNEALSLSLIMNLRGQIELFTFLHLVDIQAINEQSFTLSVLCSMMVTAISVPLIRNLYTPTKHYSTGKRRTVQDSRLDSEINIVVCIHDQENVPGLINLLEASYATKYSPISVYALHLVELIGRANPVLIAHDKHSRTSKYFAHSSFMINSFKIYEQTSDYNSSIQTFTVVSPYNTMYHDICELALEKRASIIIVPFHKRGWTSYSHNSTHMVSSRLLANAPCSVGILVDKKQHTTRVSRSLNCSTTSVAVLFFGGADAREALAYGDRISRKPSASLTVVKFLSVDKEVDDERERMLDDEFLQGFRVKNLGNDRIFYREVVVKDGEETITAIQAINKEMYDLWIMGRKQGMNPKLIQGLSDWSEYPDLGVIGDFVCSEDFGGTANVLVVQQAIKCKTMLSNAP